MEAAFVKANSSNLPRIDVVMLGAFFATNTNFCSAEFRNIKTSVRPTLTIENRIPFPTSAIVAYSKPLTFLDIIGCGLWRSQKQENETKPRGLFSVCRWYKKRRALKQLERENQNKRRYEYEKEIVKDILRWEEGKQRRKEKEQFENLYVIPLEEKKKEITLTENKKERRTLSWPKPNKVKKDIYIEGNKYDPLSWSKPDKKKKKILIDDYKTENIAKSRPKHKKAKKKEIVAEETKYEPLIWPKPECKQTKAEKKEIYVNETKYEPYAWSQPVKKKRKKTKETVIKERSATAKPKAVTKQVYVKTKLAESFVCPTAGHGTLLQCGLVRCGLVANPLLDVLKPPMRPPTSHKKDTLTHRFVSCCYRLCCQFYCCINCILVIVFVVMFVL